MEIPLSFKESDTLASWPGKGECELDTNSRYSKVVLRKSARLAMRDMHSGNCENLN